MTVNMGGEEITLAATFRASVEIADKVNDPLAIAREASLEAMFGQALQVYEPKWRFTVLNVPQIIHIGTKAAGDKRTLMDIQELVFAEGFPSARAIALEYLALIVTPKSEEVDATKETAPGE